MLLRRQLCVPIDRAFLLMPLMPIYFTFDKILLGLSLLSHRLRCSRGPFSSPSATLLLAEPPPIPSAASVPPRTSPPRLVQVPPSPVQRCPGHPSKFGKWQPLLRWQHAPSHPNLKIHCFLRLRRGQPRRWRLRGTSSPGSHREEGERRGREGGRRCLHESWCTNLTVEDFTES
jgi:hypothetical protein